MGIVTIDSKDISTYGMYLSEGAYAQLLTYPSADSPEEIDYPDVDGVYAELSSERRLQGKKMEINVVTTDYAKTSTFLQSLLYTSGSVRHSWYVEDLQKTYSLRLTSISNLTEKDNKGQLQLTLYDDANALPYNSTTLISVSVPTSDLSVAGVNLQRFGMIVEGNGFANLMKRGPQTKEKPALSYSLNGQRIYDYGTYKGTWDIEIPLHIHADKSAVATNIYTLLCYLTRAGEILLKWNNKTYGSYYKSMTVKECLPYGNGNIWCSFSVRMKIVSYK